MLDTHENRRQRNNRRVLLDRRQLEEEFLAMHAGYCERLNMRLTPKGCAELRHRILLPPPRQCADCPGMLIERRQGSRRSGGDRRKD